MSVAHTVSQAHTFPTLFKLDSKGNVQTWSIAVYDSILGGHIETSHGREGGKIQLGEEVISEGKNLGKVNETTPYEQALSEAESRWTKQIERKGYVQDKSSLTVDQRPGAEPMLAHRMDKFPEKVIYPCAVQPKLDGHRCIAVYDNGVATLFSRQRKPITGLPHITYAIEQFLAGYSGRLVLDGELYNHDYKNKFEQLTSFIRSATPKEGNTAVQYHVYDVANSSLPFEERTMALAALFDHNDRVTYTNDSNPLTYLKFVDTKLVACEEDVTEAFAHHRAQGYEGSMLRNLRSKYVPRRSYDLLKVKTFLDEEFKVVGVEEGRGKMAGHAIFVCQTEDGTKEFRAKMKGSMSNLAEYFKNADKYVGRIVTVQFQDWTADGLPRFPVAVRFREDA